MLTRLIGVSVLCGALLLVGAACERAGSSDMEEETRMAESDHPREVTNLMVSFIGSAKSGQGR